jgi:hypothetical protein
LYSVSVRPEKTSVFGRKEMVKKWLIGLGAALAIVCMAGVGFSAFTAQAVVNGSGSAATTGLEITNPFTIGCGSLYGATAPGSNNFVFYDLSAGSTSISVKATNLTPGVYCEGALELLNTGTVAVQVSVALSTPGLNGICTSYARNCYDVETLSGIEASGWQWYTYSPSAGTSCYAYSDFTTLAPGESYQDYLAVNIPAESTNPATPASGTFTVTYTASTGA